MRHISITTDFGSGVGSMRGVIWNIAPDAMISIPRFHRRMFILLRGTWIMKSGISLRVQFILLL